MAQGLSTFFFYYIVGDLALLRRSKGSIASKAWGDRTVAAMSSPGTLMFLSATPVKFTLLSALHPQIVLPECVIPPKDNSTPPTPAR